jgi:hypothetical protein
MDDDKKYLYGQRIDDLVSDIKELLEKLEQTRATDVGIKPDRLKIYLAETTDDLREERDIIKRELMEYGYEILPDIQLPVVKSKFIKKVKDFLKQCDISIHMVGKGYGWVPEDTKKSIIELQNELAAEVSKTDHLQRIIWIHPGCDKAIDDERQKLHVDRIRSNDDFNLYADLLETPINKLKHAIHDKIAHIKSSKKIFIYLAECNVDLESQRNSIKNQLVNLGYKVFSNSHFGKFLRSRRKKS